MSLEHLSTSVLLRRLDRELNAEEDAAAGRHLESCEECRAQLAKLREVSAGVDAYSSGLLQPPPAGSRRALLAAVDKPVPVRPRRWAYAAIGVAASVLLMVGISLDRVTPPKAPVPRALIAADPFISLPGSNESLSAAGAVVLQVEVPRSALAVAGMPAGDPRNERPLRAEVVVGADGLARAIRFLN